jgi:hypothetical protein
MTTIVKGRLFLDVEDIQKNVTAKLNAFPLDTFGVSSANLERCRKCVGFKGDYFEGR